MDAHVAHVVARWGLVFTPAILVEVGWGGIDAHIVLVGGFWRYLSLPQFSVRAMPALLNLEGKVSDDVVLNVPDL